MDYKDLGIKYIYCQTSNISLTLEEINVLIIQM